MRTISTALAFLVILLAVIPAVQRSLLPTERARRWRKARQRD